MKPNTLTARALYSDSFQPVSKGGARPSDLGTCHDSLALAHATEQHRWRARSWGKAAVLTSTFSAVRSAGSTGTRPGENPSLQISQGVTLPQMPITV